MVCAIVPTFAVLLSPTPLQSIPHANQYSFNIQTSSAVTVTLISGFANSTSLEFIKIFAQPIKIHVSVLSCSSCPETCMNFV
jgi:hypothetical protein